LKKGFNIRRKTFVSCTGVTLYLSKPAIRETLQKMALLASDSTIAIAFYLPIDLLDEEDQPAQEIANKGAEAAGTPFISFLKTTEVEELAKEAGLKTIETVYTKDMAEKYFKNRTDGLIPASGEFFLVAKI
jgi:O-methyltransferase involved in polyketide biosynthesis